MAPTLFLLRSCLFLFASNLAASSLSSHLSFNLVAYEDHCNSIVPKPAQIAPRLDRLSHLPELQHCHFHGGQQLYPKDPAAAEYSLLAGSAYFSAMSTEHVISSSDADHVFGIQTTLFLRPGAFYTPAFNGSNRMVYRTRAVSFSLAGFWSRSLGKMCLVSSEYGSSLVDHHDQGRNFVVVVKLNFPNGDANATFKTYFSSGSIESLSPKDSSDYFNPIVLLYLSSNLANYEYTLLTDARKGCSAVLGSSSRKSMNLHTEKGFCSNLWELSYHRFDMEYLGACKQGVNSCQPFGEFHGLLPTSMSIGSPTCTEDEKLHMILEFTDDLRMDYGYHDLLPTVTMVSEGVWDKEQSRICLVACRFLNSGDSLADVHVDDCSIGLSLWVPESLSIRDRSPIMGSMWSNKKVNESGYFNKIVLRSQSERNLNMFGLKYEYTQTKLVRKSCKKAHAKNGRGYHYPDGQSYGGMQISFSVKNEPNTILGTAIPVTFGENFYKNYRSTFVLKSANSIPSQKVANWDSYSSLMKMKNIAESKRSTPLVLHLEVSYMISFNLPPGYIWRKNSSSAKPDYTWKKNSISYIPDYALRTNYSSASFSEIRVSIFAEGIYDPNTGTLCMVGCQEMENSSMDCEILINVQFPPINPTAEDYFNGTIASTRNKSDPLYFEPLVLSSEFLYASQAKEWLWRMDMEVVMSIISLTLSCIFTALQIFHVRRHPDTLPSISLLMLFVLALGQITPMLWSLSALVFNKHNLQNVIIESGGWIEANAAIVIIVTLLTFLLLCRLLQMVLSARSVADVKVDFWMTEMYVTFICVHIHALGSCLGAASFVIDHYGRNSDAPSFVSDHYGRNSGLWESLRSYYSLFLDVFLLPQVLFNLFLNSKEKSLSPSFYIGTTATRTLSHVYNVYRANHYIPQTQASSIYASWGDDLFPTWEITVLIAGLLFALVVWLQQRYGGACIIPQWFRQPSENERLPIPDSASEI